MVWCHFVQALDILGSTKWRVNRPILDVVESIWSRGGGIGGLVDCEDVSRNGHILFIIERFAFSFLQCWSMHQLFVSSCVLYILYFLLGS